MWLTGLVTPRHVGSSQTRARTRVPCIGRQILNHCATREAPNLRILNLTSPDHPLKYLERIRDTLKSLLLSCFGIPQPFLIGCGFQTFFHLKHIPLACSSLLMSTESAAPKPHKHRPSGIDLTTQKGRGSYRPHSGHCTAIIVPSPLKSCVNRKSLCFLSCMQPQSLQPFF